MDTHDISISNDNTENKNTIVKTHDLIRVDRRVLGMILFS